MSTGDDESKGSGSFVSHDLKDVVRLVEHASVSHDRPLVTVTAQKVSFLIPAKTLSERLFPYVYGREHRETNMTMTPFDVNEGCELLHNINFIAKPNELTAIMGPSGCGKTTFMNVLAQRASGTVLGSIAYNNAKASPRNLKGCMSMCYSTDKLLPYLSVEETLHFATILKMGQATPQERRKRVSEVIEEMALGHVRHTRVGGVWKKGLSSGEVRRTSIAVELIGDPAVMLLDEPTSGLDAVLALEIIWVLKDLASKGRTIICSIHQPRVAIFDLFDSLMLMSCGRSIFHGPTAHARSYVETIAVETLPRGLNTADALIEVASAPSDKIQTMISNYEGSDHYAAILGQVERARSVDASAIRFGERNPYVQWFVEVGAVCFRTFRNSIRNPLSFTVLLAVQVLMGCFLGAFFFKIENKFLPDTIPTHAGDPNGPLLKFFDNSLVQFANTGIDGTGYNPFLELLISGPDGNMSEPFLQLQDTSVYQHLYNNLLCAHEKFELDLLYNDSDYTEFWNVWGENGDGDEVYAGGSSMSPPVVTSYLMKTFQVLDYLLSRYQWSSILKFMRIQNTNYLTAQVACRTDIRELANVMSACQGISHTPILRYTKNTQSTMLRIACGFKGSETEDPPATRQLPSASLSPFSASPSLDLRGNADWAAAAAERRQLQVLGLMSGGAMDLSKILPRVLVRILERVPAYQETFTTCDHEFCRLLAEQLETQSTSGDAAGSLLSLLAALSQYGSVLGALMNVVGALFFAVGNSGFASYDALVSIPQDRVMINREMANNLYRPSSYFAGKVIADASFQLVPALCLSICFYVLIGVDMGEHGLYFGRYLGICMLMVFAAYGFAYLISALSPSMEVAVIAAPLILVIFHACAGFFVRDTALPVWMAWVKYLSYYRWGFFGLTLNQFPEGEDYNGLPNSFTLAVIGVSEKRMWVNCLALIMLGIGYRILAYFPIKYMYRRVGIEH
eukprot:Gregarina_sp_Pseudo_9__644@NODE_140_length_3998_cov_16_769134_g129_i0_p1_GENE_NODE_140_length_3998_cov_16_769134_g129_i0NODE_140_length_3998_cov_16_769134_g129_i0_p1_ORF_typecomplete_len965_score200_87ABC2_membrane/PF01061_24/0_54ABC2_membrane/PF01061_24/8_1e30ABC_tran/PF00005_27/5_4e26ABC2_membrane_3/PF12698_7/9_9e02ABC2_membrane_3/PF12698_7/5e10AAA_21/PF13304_6/21AAA_21/PF13304_6/0_0022CcmB/PF03379_13/0_0003AAA_33/PF13671_6/0_0017ABC2_membrane_2/PF12679_7/2_6e03ABC2_membrane_2/PF12679_7/3_3e03